MPPKKLSSLYRYTTWYGQTSQQARKKRIPANSTDLIHIYSTLESIKFCIIHTHQTTIVCM